MATLREKICSAGVSTLREYVCTTHTGGQCIDDPILLEGGLMADMQEDIVTGDIKDGIMYADLSDDIYSCDIIASDINADMEDKNNDYSI